MSEPLRTVNVGLIGLGTVGGGVARLIKEQMAADGMFIKTEAVLILDLMQ